MTFFTVDPYPQERHSADVAAYTPGVIVLAGVRGAVPQCSVNEISKHRPATVLFMFIQSVPELAFGFCGDRVSADPNHS